ncbi:MAG: UvrD-helicase domain-containing protein [Firmicutes bacterium]|nr:UvrD-helicase domain-containing protein [Bacillota bacterium]
MNDILQELNPPQREAVLNTEGPLLILAGAGSGKTRVITNRIAYLITEKNVSPHNILAITFTKKAAGEMRNRVEDLTGMRGFMWISTFHSACLKILRIENRYIPYEQGFSVSNTDETERCIKNILKDFSIDSKQFPAKYIANLISEAKDKLISPENAYGHFVKEKHFTGRDGDIVQRIYEEYQKRLLSSNTMDYGDIIFECVKLFENNPEILRKYGERFKYIMVDEYQDTNKAQYIFVQLLSSVSRNICVVGDDDQSIYGWRGADIANILNFEDDFPETNIIKLEQNYRSSKYILDGANAVISHNIQRHEKKLWTEDESDEKISVHSSYSDLDEVDFISDKIAEGIKKGKHYKDFAVLYRANYLSRKIEECFIKRGIQYKLLSGTEFYDRMEIQDMVSYLKVISNNYADMPLLRIINVPKRKIGATTVEKVRQYALERDISLFSALEDCEKIEGISAATKKNILGFTDMIRHFSEKAKTKKTSLIFKELLSEIAYIEDLKSRKEENTQARIENIEEFENTIAEFERGYTQNEEDVSQLSAFLENIALYTDTEKYNKDDDAVLLMTVHSAKGLEFENVFLTAFEENIFPSYMSLADEDINGIEEERRLCYVAMTRAKKKLYITCSSSRMSRGQFVYNMPSRFLEDIPREYITEE